MKHRIDAFSTGGTFVARRILAVTIQTQVPISPPMHTATGPAPG
ncbi:hypothetical protein [Phytoactinopolyspora halotolerans]|nr:hypothetical protein [Phytoactinopolyspora halotolerans]